MNFLNFLLSAGIGYLLGSLPFAVVIAKCYGVNILKYGSGNPGATNVTRACGKFAGRLCFFLDAVKGFAAASWVFFAVENSLELACVGIVFAVFGHSFSVFLKFKGGKGVSVVIGGLCAIMYWSILIGLAIWLVVFFLSRMVSLASIIMAVSLPISCGFFFGAFSLPTYFALAIAIFVIYRHKENIKRILNKTEYRFGDKK